jgi:hypothetical protein
LCSDIRFKIEAAEKVVQSFEQNMFIGQEERKEIMD